MRRTMCIRSRKSLLVPWRWLDARQQPSELAVDTLKVPVLLPRERVVTSKVPRVGRVSPRSPFQGPDEF
ncbi:hypothetical protein AERO9AM_10287 [Aeromicrobium sp. 9AM]|nr:hypothetical protein AERO9AM_10287 [Aeromicrobium sp. 9AM]